MYDQEVASSIAGQNDSGQVAHVQVPLSPSHQAECNLVPVKAGVYTGTPRNALAPYPRSHRASWCLADGYRNGKSALPWYGVAWEGLYVGRIAFSGP